MSYVLTGFYICRLYGLAFLISSEGHPLICFPYLGFLFTILSETLNANDMYSKLIMSKRLLQDTRDYNLHVHCLGICGSLRQSLVWANHITVVLEGKPDLTAECQSYPGSCLTPALYPLRDLILKIFCGEMRDQDQPSLAASC